MKAVNVADTYAVTRKYIIGIDLRSGDNIDDSSSVSDKLAGIIDSMRAEEHAATGSPLDLNDFVGSNVQSDVPIISDVLYQSDAIQTFEKDLEDVLFGRTNSQTWYKLVDYNLVSKEIKIDPIKNKFPDSNNPYYVIYNLSPNPYKIHDPSFPTLSKFATIYFLDNVENEEALSKYNFQFSEYGTTFVQAGINTNPFLIRLLLLASERSDNVYVYVINNDQVFKFHKRETIDPGEIKSYVLLAQTLT